MRTENICKVNLILVIFSCALIFTLNIELVNALNDSQIEEIDNYLLNEYLPRNYIPGFGLTIVHGNDTLAKGYGIADLELGLLAGNHTLFGLASITKSFTGLIAIRVLNARFPELGESVLDVPIRTLIPSYNFMLIDRFRSENMNFRDLLSHRVCITTDQFGLVLTNISTEEYMYRHRYAESICPVRTDLVYQNGLLHMVGELAAAIANTTYTQLLDEFLIELGMNETTYFKESDDIDNWTNLAKPYYRFNGNFSRYNSNLFKIATNVPATAGILSTPADFVRYLTFQLNNGRIGSNQIVPEELMRWTRKLSNSNKYFSYKTSASDVLNGDLGYGLGLFVGTFEGYFKFGHAGVLAPHLALMTIVPALNVAIMTVGNGPGTLRNITQDNAHIKLLSIITGVGKRPAKQNSDHAILPYSPLSMSKPDKKQQMKVHSQIPAYLLQNWELQPKNDSLIGMYGNPFVGEFNITAINSTTLYLNYGILGKGYLNQSGNSLVYEIQWDSDIVHSFYANGADIIPIATLDFTIPFVAELNIPGLGSRSFYKDLALELLPIQPWDPNSCY